MGVSEFANIADVNTSVQHDAVAAELIVEARKQADLSQAELARRAGLPRSVLNAYENGRRQPGVDALARILAAAGRELRLGRAVRTLDDKQAE